MGATSQARGTVGVKVRALSVQQPWAELIASGRKSIELRTWTTKYRGPLVIVASLKRSTHADAARFDEDGLRGHAVALVELVDVRLATPDDAAASCVQELPVGTVSWVLARPVRTAPVAMRGKLGLFNCEPVARLSLAR